MKFMLSWILFFFVVCSLTAETHQSSRIIQTLKEANLPASMKVPFREVRHYQLKKTDTLFTGVMRILPGRGISIEYQEPSERIFVLSPTGLIIRTEGKLDKQAPEEAISMVKVFLDLLTLNEEALSGNFLLSEKIEETHWMLTLFPKNNELKRFFQVIDLEGVDSVLQSIYIKNGRSRWKKITFTAAPVEWIPTDSAISHYF